MLKRTLIILSIAVALIVAIQPVRSVHGILLSASEVAALNAANTPVAKADNQASQGNSFLRALKAPFKAIGRLFGHGKKDNNKLQRISEKDIKKFESVPAKQDKVTNATLANATANPPGFDTSNAAGDLTANLPANQPVDLKIAIEHLENGRALLSSGKLDEAIDELSKAASLDRTLAEARTLLGVAYEGKGFHDRAMKSFEAAVEAQNNNPQVLNNLGYALYSNHDYEGATKYLKKAVKLAPDDARIWNNLGLAQCERGKFDDAFKSFTHAIGEVKSRVNIAERLRYQGSTEEAIKHLEKARALAPNSPEVLAPLLNLYLVSERTEQAQEAKRSLIAAQALATAPAPE